MGIFMLIDHRSRKPIKNNISSRTPKPVVCFISRLLTFLTRWTVGKKVTTKEKRWFKDVGLGFKTPSEAINGTYIGMGLHSQIYFSCSHSLRQEMPFHG